MTFFLPQGAWSAGSSANRFGIAVWRIEDRMRTHLGRRRIAGSRAIKCIRPPLAPVPALLRLIGTHEPVAMRGGLDEGASARSLAARSAVTPHAASSNGLGCRHHGEWFCLRRADSGARRAAG